MPAHGSEPSAACSNNVVTGGPVTLTLISLLAEQHQLKRSGTYATAAAASTTATASNSVAANISTTAAITTATATDTASAGAWHRILSSSSSAAAACSPALTSPFTSTGSCSNDVLELQGTGPAEHLMQPKPRPTLCAPNEPSGYWHGKSSPCGITLTQPQRPDHPLKATTTGLWAASGSSEARDFDDVDRAAWQASAAIGVGLFEPMGGSKVGLRDFADHSARLPPCKSPDVFRPDPAHKQPTLTSMARAVARAACAVNPAPDSLQRANCTHAGIDKRLPPGSQDFPSALQAGTGWSQTTLSSQLALPGAYAAMQPGPQQSPPPAPLAATQVAVPPQLDMRHQTTTLDDTRAPHIGLPDNGRYSADVARSLPGMFHPPGHGAEAPSCPHIDRAASAPVPTLPAFGCEAEADGRLRSASARCFTAAPGAHSAPSLGPEASAPLGEPLQRLPSPVTVQVASRSRRPGDGPNGSSRVTRGAVGVFYPQLYLTGGDCIECGTEIMSRGRFERLAGTATAKWHVSIKVLPSGMTLGRWLQHHGLPILQGRPRKRRLDADEDEADDVNGDRAGSLPQPRPRSNSAPGLPSQPGAWVLPPPLPPSSRRHTGVPLVGGAAAAYASVSSPSGSLRRAATSIEFSGRDSCFEVRPAALPGPAEGAHPSDFLGAAIQGVSSALRSDGGLPSFHDTSVMHQDGLVDDTRTSITGLQSHVEAAAAAGVGSGSGAARNQHLPTQRHLEGVDPLPAPRGQRANCERGIRQLPMVTDSAGNGFGAPTLHGRWAGPGPARHYSESGSAADASVEGGFAVAFSVTRTASASHSHESAVRPEWLQRSDFGSTSSVSGVPAPAADPFSHSGPLPAFRSVGDLNNSNGTVGRMVLSSDGRLEGPVPLAERVAATELAARSGASGCPDGTAGMQVDATWGSCMGKPVLFGGLNTRLEGSAAVDHRQSPPSCSLSNWKARALEVAAGGGASLRDGWATPSLPACLQERACDDTQVLRPDTVAEGHRPHRSDGMPLGQSAAAGFGSAMPSQRTVDAEGRVGRTKLSDNGRARCSSGSRAAAGPGAPPAEGCWSWQPSVGGLRSGAVAEEDPGPNGGWRQPYPENQLQQGQLHQQQQQQQVLQPHNVSPLNRPEQLHRQLSEPIWTAEERQHQVLQPPAHEPQLQQGLAQPGEVWFQEQQRQDQRMHQQQLSALFKGAEGHKGSVQLPSRLLNVYAGVEGYGGGGERSLGSRMLGGSGAPVGAQGAALQQALQSGQGWAEQQQQQQQRQLHLQEQVLMQQHQQQQLMLQSRQQQQQHVLGGLGLSENVQLGTFPASNTGDTLHWQ